MLTKEQWIDKIAQALRRAWPDGKAVRVAAPALPGAAGALVVLALHHLHPDRDVVAIATGPDETEALFTDIRSLSPVNLPDPFLLYAPESGDSRDIEREGMRLAVARELFAAPAGKQSGRIFISSGTALLAPLPDPIAVEKASKLLKMGEDVDSFEDLAHGFVQTGYDRVGEVTAKGQLAVRGGLLDIWPPTAPLPVRIDFFGDTIETIREFDPATQRSGARLKEVWIAPSGSKSLPSIPPAEKLPEGAIVLWLDHDRIAGATLRPEDEVPTPFAWEKLLQKVDGRSPRRQLFTGDPPPADLPTMALDVVPAPGLADIAENELNQDVRANERKRLLDDLRERADGGQNVRILLDTAGGVEWLSQELGEDTPIDLRQGLLSGGCEWPGLGLVLLGQSDIYAVHKRSSRKLVPPAIANRGGRIERSEELKPGDLVVHVDHGIGRFEGINELEINGKKQEVMTILYADDAKLHVPVSHAHLLSRYIGVAGQRVKLHKLGSKRWRQDCIKAERSIVDYAAALLEVQARRNSRPGFAYDVKPPWMESFEAAFPFKETPDQIKCIEAIKEDMAAAKPMDRLICGDAGYGKTEVAMRAAFLAVMNGKQVAVLTPTTVLAEQHYATFRERMEAFPVRIEVLSRLRSQTERKNILHDTAQGGVDILIGTHAILQNSVTFHDIGLVVIDEEQRFGVVQKERLKQLRATVDVLTLSATPIPRTLYMSMTGARDLSLLQTPPQERLAIETHVERDRDSIIRSAVLRELNREGQVFFLHNRVVTMPIVYKRLKTILPEARIEIAHGQQSADELGKTMHRFEAGEFDVLLCTTIIESGLDIPRANTIIINRADRFGLADLYQLRGRVGRSSRRGYAYLLIPPQGVMDEEARQRIKALQRHGGLGGGLNLALRDLEIRGAGNILGAEQSGHIAAVGFGLYCQLLRRTIARLKGENPPLLIDVDLQLDFLSLSPDTEENPFSATGIPYSYLDDERLRMNFHRRIAEAVSVQEIRELRAEMDERFGKPPIEVIRMLRMAELRILAAAAGYVHIHVKDKIVHLQKRNGQPYLDGKGKLPRISDKSPDAKLTALFRIVSAATKK